jgi:phospholipid/cholesterol/gamma-HCH transport system permease protein
MPKERLPGLASLLEKLHGGKSLTGLERAVLMNHLADGEETGTTELPDDLRKIHELRSAQPVRSFGNECSARGGGNLFERAGLWGIEQGKGILEILSFTGEWCLGLLRLVTGRASFPRAEFWMILRSVSTQALPIVSLISFLVGLIISFLGAVVLSRFGAEFAVAYLVGFGMLREMGAVMTGIIMAGRTGAAFAAQIGSMKVNEEIDALRTFAISPIDYLVTPRLLALFIMMPLLTLYANVVGILSGWLVAEGLMGVSSSIYFSEMASIVDLGDFLLGIFKAAAFGGLVGTAGCLRGLQSGSGANAVGEAATRAVVTGITLIILANAIIDWAAAALNI